jgi:Sir2 family
LLVSLGVSTHTFDFASSVFASRLHHRAGSNPLELHGTVYTVICLDCGTSIDRKLFQEQLKAANPKVHSESWCYYNVRDVSTTFINGNISAAGA